MVELKENSHQRPIKKWVKSLPGDLAEQKPQRLESLKSDELALAYAARARARSQWEELKEQSILAYESGLLPRSIDSRQKAITIALMGRELGLSPMQALCGIYVVNGMTALRGSLMLRLIYERVSGAQITVVTPPEMADTECTVEMCRPHGKPHTFRFTLEDAKKASFLNKPIWQHHTSTMLRWAAIRTGARVVFADAIAGCYMEDELPAQSTLSVVESREEKLSVSSESLGADMSEFPAPSPATPVNQLAKRVTDKQINRLYAIAHDKKWTRQEIGMWIEKEFKKRDPHDMNRVEYDTLCNFLLESARKVDASTTSQESAG